jgi:quinol monooxygenase YgiN
MPIRQVVTFHLKPGGAAAFLEGFLPIVERVRVAPGCEQYDLFVSHENPDCLLMLERWRDLAALEAALAAYKPANPPAFLQTLARPPVRERYQIDF